MPETTRRSIQSCTWPKAGLVALPFSMLSVPAFAAIPLGPFELTPEVILEQRYDSNIFLESNLYFRVNWLASSQILR